MSTSRAFGILVVVSVVVSAFLALAAWLGLREYWVAFLFLLQWGLMEELKLDRLPKSAIGAAAGITLGFLPEFLTPLTGKAVGLAMMLAIVFLVVFLRIKGAATLVVNGALMIFLGVVTIPHILHEAAPAQIYFGLAAGLVYFGGLAQVVALVTKPKIAPVKPVVGHGA